MAPTQSIAWLAAMLITALQERERVNAELDRALRALDDVASAVMVRETSRTE
jgi:hypothetical protein